jgi:hypothetical protein
VDPARAPEGGGDESLSLIHFELPFRATAEEFAALHEALLAESSGWRAEHLPLLERLADGKRAARPRLAVDGRRLVVLLHECAHFWHAIGTTYGFHYIRATMAQGHCVHELLRLLDSLGVAKLRLPLRSLPTDGLSDAARAQVDRLRERWTALEKYKSVLHAFTYDPSLTPERFGKEVWLPATEALHAFDHLSQTFENPGSEPLRLELPADMPELAPLQKLYGTRLSGQAVMEAAAVMQEMLLIPRLQENGLLPEDYLEQRIGEVAGYGIAFELLHERVPELLEERNRLILWRLVPLLFDLALMGPCDHVYVEPLPAVTKWLDIHPGFRFVLILDTLKEIGLKPIWHNRYFARGYTKLIGLICARNGWPTPWRLAGVGKRRRLAFRGQYDDLMAQGMTLMSTNPAMDVILRHFDAATVRADYPAGFAEVLVGFGYLFEQFRPPFFRLADRSVVDASWNGYYSHQKVMRTLFTGTARDLETAFDNAPSQFGKEIDALARASFWARIGYPRERCE